MINNIHTLQEKNLLDFLDVFNEEEIYFDNGDFCVDLEKDNFGFTVIFEKKTSLTGEDKTLLFSLLEKVVDLDYFVANRMNPYRDYEFELSYIQIGSSVSFSYRGINVNSTWEFEFEIIREDGNYAFKSKFNNRSDAN